MREYSENEICLYAYKTRIFPSEWRLFMACNFPAPKHMRTSPESAFHRWIQYFLNYMHIFERTHVPLSILVTQTHTVLIYTSILVKHISPGNDAFLIATKALHMNHCLLDRDFFFVLDETALWNNYKTLWVINYMSFYMNIYELIKNKLKLYIVLIRIKFGIPLYFCTKSKIRH